MFKISILAAIIKYFKVKDDEFLFLFLLLHQQVFVMLPVD